MRGKLKFLVSFALCAFCFALLPQAVSAQTVPIDYVWNPPPLVATSSASLDLRNKLTSEIDKMVQDRNGNGRFDDHLLPFVFSRGLAANREFYFLNPADTLLTLSIAYPYVSAPVQAKIKEYLTNEVVQYPPTQVSFCSLWPNNPCLKNGFRREYAPVPDDMLGDAWYGPSANPPLTVENLYGLWAYGYYLGEWGYLSTNYTDIKSTYTSFRTSIAGSATNIRYLSQIGGLIGFARIAQQLGDTATAQEAADLAALALQASSGDGFTTYKSSAESQITGTLGHYYTVPLFHYNLRADGFSNLHVLYMSLFPKEVGLFLRNNSQTQVRTFLNGLESFATGWEITKSGNSVGGENAYNPQDVKWTTFMLRAYTLADTQETLRKFLDTPISIGDLYYLQMLTAAIEAPSPTPTPAPSPCTIASASWSAPSNPVTEGTTITLTTSTSGDCSGRLVNFTVRENDSLIEGGLDEDARIQPGTAAIIGSSAQTTWVAEWQNDCLGLCNPPEYYFNATVVGAGTPTVRSADPLLSVNKAPIINLITNGDFETGTLAGWTPAGAIATTSATVKNGNFAARSTEGSISRAIAVTAGRTYKLTAWANITSVTGGSWGGPTIQVINTSTTPWTTIASAPVLQEVMPTGSWTKVGFTFTPTTSSVLLTVGLYGDRLIDVAFDDIMLFEQPASNTPPTASVSSGVTMVSTLPGTVTFTSTADDLDGAFETFWDFGDGGRSTLPNPTHQYISNGSYTVRLTVVDDQNASTVAQGTITVNDPAYPNLTISSPSTTTVSTPSVAFSGTATAGSGATLSRVEWSTDRGQTGSATGTNSWSFNLNLTNQSGKNRVMIDAFDSSGKVARQDLVVNYRPSSRVSIAGGAAGVTQNASTVEQYEKLEATFKIQDGVFSNPYVPYETNLPVGMKAIDGQGVTVEGIFTSPTSKIYRQPGFYYQPYTRNTATRQLVASSEPEWKIRFAPQETGNWTYQVSVTDASGTTLVSAPSLTFNVTTQTNPNNHGFIKVSPTDRRYFEFSDGTPFIGVGPGPVLGAGDENNFNTDANLALVASSSANLSRTWMSGDNIGGSSWAPWAGGIEYDGNVPGTSLTTEEAYGDGIFSFTLPQLTSSASRCAFYGFVGTKPSVKPATNYRVLVRLKTVNVPTTGGFNLRFGGIAFPAGCDGYPGTSPFSSPISGTKDWHAVTGIWNSGTQTQLGYLLLTLENVTSGRVYIDEISMREDLGGGVLGPEVLPRSKFNVHEYFSQQTSWDWDYGLDEFAKRGIYEKIVIEEKQDLVYNRIAFSGFGSSFGGNMQKIGSSSYKYQQYYWRYLVARYGYSRAVHSFEFVNEDAPGTLAFPNEMAKYIHSIDPNRHLATTSFWADIQAGGNYFWQDVRYGDIDYADAHSYVNAPPDNSSWLQGVTYPLTFGTNSIPSYASLGTDSALYPFAHSMDVFTKNAAGSKPIIIGEAGLGSGTVVAGRNDADTQGVWLHQFIWSQVNPGGAHFIYWYDDTIKSNRLYSLFATYRQFMEGKQTDTVNTRTPLTNGNYQDIQLTLPAGVRGWGQKDAVNGGVHFWIYDSGYTWTTPAGGAALGGRIVSFDFGPTARSYTIEWWDTWSGTVTTESRSHPGGVMSLTVPSTFTGKDVAVKIYPSTGYVAVGPSPACTITSASWSVSSAVEGTPINLNVTTSGSCIGKQVSFRVRENDSILEGGLDEDARVQPATVAITGGTVVGTWSAEWQNDCAGLCLPPEYFFEALVVGEVGSRRSADPMLTTTQAGLLPTPTPVVTVTPTPTPAGPLPTATPTTPPSTPTPTPIVSPTPFLTPTPTPTPAPCTLTSASWSSATATEGESMTLTVNGQNCAGRQVSFDVRENDSLLEGGIDDPALVQPSPVIFSGNTVTTTWSAEWQNDCAGLCLPPEYFFTATVTGGNSLRSSDPLLRVSRATFSITQGPTVSTTLDSATISWTTDVPSSSRVYYGILDQYLIGVTLEYDLSPRVTNHSTTLTNLRSCTKYRYQVQSRDISGNTITRNSDFTTRGCPGDSNILSEISSFITQNTGGLLNLLDASEKGIKLSIPNLFYTTDAFFQVKQLEKDKVITTLPAPQGLTPAGNHIYRVDALTDLVSPVASFSGTINVTITYTGADIQGINPNSLKIHRFNTQTNSWEELSNCQVDTVNKTVICQTTRFSEFALMGQRKTQTNNQALAVAIIMIIILTPLVTHHTVKHYKRRKHQGKHH